MGRERFFSAFGVAVAGAALLLPSLSFGALAKAAGGSGYSGSLSSSLAVRQQQLICDPVEPILGSTSVLYEPDKVSLTDFIYGPGYVPIDQVPGVVEVRVGTETRLQNIISFLDSPQGEETGYVQIYYRLTGTAGQITPTGQLLDEDPGPGTPGEGVDTHQLTFAERTPIGGAAEAQGVFPVVVTTYKIYADPGNTHSGNPADFLVGLNDAGNRFQLDPAQLQGATVTSPEPSAAAVLVVAGAGLLGRRRRN